jgi:cytochrome o ubiquinol oxidase subunit 1
MHFFTNGLGGNMMMYPNLFWVWGHPEVYILILPAFGVFSEVVPTFSAKRLFGYKSMVYATAAIGVLSFAVWLHHFFTMGAGADLNAFFGITTMIIDVPTGVKVFNWLSTLYQGRVRISAPLLWVLGFFAAFAVGGMSGVLLALPPADFVLHNTLFLVAHFHNMLIPGALFAYLAGYMYWFPEAFGFTLSEKWGKRAFWAWLVGFYVAFIPLYALGFMGMPRRMEHYANPAWQPWLILAAAGAVIIMLGIAFLVVQLLVSIRVRAANRDLTGDPRNGRTLEWATSSPPPAYNFAEIPVVDGLDAVWQMKRKGTPYPRAAKYHDIQMPKSTPTGFLLGVFAFLFGFAMIWYIWWLAIAAALEVLATVVARSFNDDIEYVIPPPRWSGSRTSAAGAWSRPRNDPPQPAPFPNRHGCRP